MTAARNGAGSKPFLFRFWRTCGRTACKSSDRVRRWASPDRDPTHLGELLESCVPAKSAPPAVFTSAKGHLRLIVNRGAVTVADAGFEALGKFHCLAGIAAEHGAGEAVLGVIGGAALHAGNAAAAASIARRASARPAGENLAMISTMNGLVFSKVRPSCAPCHSPSMNNSWFCSAVVRMESPFTFAAHP